MPIASTMPSSLAASAYVAFGGGAGALARYQLGRAMTRWLGPSTMTAFPWATLTVNVAGSLAMGLLAGFLARHGNTGEHWTGEHWRLLIGVGLLGGFTTFSSFSLELMLLIERGQSSYAFIYAAVSVLAGLTALYLGLIVMRIVG
ncbi:MAG TPA: fluoride efflux transporter CrcB [Novosphingobium sp.]|nr:fluoride efflux transporter CrcB [Novosphingobium sp.]